MEVEDLLKARRLELLKKQSKLMKQYGLLFYKPHQKQKEFHASADFRFRLARCGNRFGKSDMGVSEDLAFALGERPWIPESDPARYIGIPKRPTKGLVIAADLDKVDEIFTGNGSKGHIGKIWKKISKEVVVGTKKGSSGTIINIRIQGKHGESVIDFDTRSAYKNNPMGSESSDYDWCHVDEPIEEGHWKAILRGLTDRGGKAWFTCTLIEQPWISDFFFKNEDLKDDVPDQSKEYYQLVEQSGRKVKWVMTGSIFDNPYLSEDNIRDFLNTLTEEEQECRIHGVPMHLAGLVYKEFKKSIHLITERPEGWKTVSDPPADHTIYVSIDPHPRTPHAVLFIAVSPKGRAVIFDEIFDACTTSDLTKQILQVTKNRHCYTIVMDPSAWIEDQRTKYCMADDMLALGLIGVQKGSKDLKRGIMAVKQAWKDGWLSVTSNCRTFQWEISRWAWGDKGGVPTNKPVDKDDHLMECLYRLVLEGLIYIPPSNLENFVGPESFTDNLLMQDPIDLDEAQWSGAISVHE